jgi:glycosyltransferase involved in cell wall biosynthesis
MRRLTRPGLHRPRQYRPRKLAVARSYDHEELPAEPPSFAIVTPSYNQAPYLRAAIDSVLAQGYPRLSYLVVDGNSSDGTLSILSGHGDAFEWLSEPDGGQADAINKGFAHIEGDVMGWLNSDDLLLPGTLAYVARFFAQHPEVDLVYGHRIYIDATGLETGRAVLPPHDRAALDYFDYIPQETLFWRRRVWAKVGPLDSAFEFALDWDFVLRSAAAGFSFRRLPRFLGCLRSHSQQKTARLASLGNAEADRLRRRIFKRDVPINEVSHAVRPYRIRQIIWQWGYRIGLPVSK